MFMNDVALVEESCKNWARYFKWQSARRERIMDYQDYNRVNRV